MLGKKGMSPLIATILLMAFAVALGAVIMNWSAKIPEGGSDCQEAGVEVSIRQFCVADGVLTVELRNTGESSIKEISLSVSDPPIEVPHMSVSKNELGRGQTFRQEIPFGFSANAKIGITPSIEDKGEIVQCSTPVKVYDALPTCS